MCEHCDVLTNVLIQLFGNKVTEMIMERASAQLHGTLPPLAAKSGPQLVPLAANQD